MRDVQITALLDHAKEILRSLEIRHLNDILCDFSHAFVRIYVYNRTLTAVFYYVVILAPHTVLTSVQTATLSNMCCPIDTI